MHLHHTIADAQGGY